MRLTKNKKVHFDEFTHTYISDDDKLLMGVTTLMKKHGLAPDYGNIPEEVLARAAEKGTAVHALLEDYDNGKAVIEDDNLRAYKSLGLAVHCSEYLVSDNSTVATLIDKVLDDCSIADVKHTSQVHKHSVAWQCSIGAYLFELQNPSKKVPHIYCIHVRDGKAKLIELNRVPDEKVKALLDAEAAGVIYKEEVEDVDAGLVLTEDKIQVLSHGYHRIALLKQEIKQWEQQIGELESTVYQYMVDNNLDEIACADGKLVRKAEYTRTSFDSTRFKKDHPDTYNNYLKTTPVKGSVTFKANDME